MSKARLAGTAPQRLGVVGDHRPVAGGDDQLGRVGALAGQRVARRRPRRRSATSARAATSSPSGTSGGAAASASSSPASVARSPERRPRRTPRCSAVASSRARRLGLLLLGERLLEPAQRVAQLVLAEQLAQPRAVRRALELLGQVEVHRHVAADRRQLLGDARVLGVVGQVLLALGAGDLVDRGEHRLEVAEALQQVRRRLVADARDARDVVRRVALEAVEVGDQLVRDAVALEHLLAAVDLRLGDPARGRHHAHAVADDLERVAVAGDDHHRDAALLGLLGQRGDHVVGLEAVDLVVAVAERLDQRLQLRPLLLEQVGRELRWAL